MLEVKVYAASIYSLRWFTDLNPSYILRSMIFNSFLIPLYALRLEISAGAFAMSWLEADFAEIDFRPH